MCFFVRIFASIVFEFLFMFLNAKTCLTPHHTTFRVFPYPIHPTTYSTTVRHPSQTTLFLHPFPSLWSLIRWKLGACEHLNQRTFGTKLAWLHKRALHTSSVPSFSICSGRRLMMIWISHLKYHTIYFVIIKNQLITIEQDFDVVKLREVSKKFCSCIRIVENKCEYMLRPFYLLNKYNCASSIDFLT